LVSACLLGERCRYDGQVLSYPGLLRTLEGAEVVAVCPEREGGLPTPRVPCDLQGGDGAAVWCGVARVLDRQGRDRTAQFRAGAQRCLEAAPDAAWALLKARSPSCGLRQVHVDGRLVPGQGVFAALLAQHGVRARDEER